MEELNFYVKKLQDLEYRGEWKEHYRHSYEKVRDIIDKSQYMRRSMYLKELDRLNQVLMEMPYIADDEDKLHFRKAQKSTIDLVYQVMTENKRIFLVHGPNSHMAHRVSSFLGRLKLDYDLLEDAGEQQDVKKFTKKAKNCDFAIVLFSADELIYPDMSSTGKYRVSQNVLIELGYFLSHAGKKNILIFHTEDKEIEKPYNLEGLPYYPFEQNGNWKRLLVDELQKAGIYLDAATVEKMME